MRNDKLLLELADVLEQHEGSFDMRWFRPSTYKCGCAAHVGYRAGIGCSVPSTPRTSSKEIFWMYVNQFTTEEAEQDWLFASGWFAIDNTAAGAAARIRHLVANGLPDDHVDQQRGLVPYLFTAIANK